MASFTHSSGETPVFFDLETTGLDTFRCDIVQMSAISGSRVFNVYIVPRIPMTHQASDVTGLTTDNQNLLLHGKRVPTVPLQEALNSFISFLKAFNKPFLVGHNCKKFDCPVLRRILNEFKLLGLFQGVVSGCLDTFLLSKRMFPRLREYSQPSLFKHFLGTSYGAHNATEDARALQQLYYAWAPNPVLINLLKFRFA